MVGELVAGRYELEELIGSGGMSNVYRAKDRLLERNVALKILHQHYTQDEDYVERFRHEARAAAQLAHPNIVTVIDRGEDDGRQYIVFELIEGENLKQLVERSGPLPVRDALELGIQIARALAFAHEQGLIHRDVKPQNVLLGNGDAKVTDFGIARSLDVKRGLTQTGTVLGTSDYIAPEQASGEGASEASDVYSLGAVLYELLTGKPPFRGDNFVAVAMQHLNEPVPSAAEQRPDVPFRLDHAVSRAMAKDPGDRFASMTEFGDELAGSLRELGTPDGDRTMILREPPKTLRSRRVQPPKRRLFPIWAALALVLAGGVAVGALLVLRDTGGGSANPGTTNGTTGTGTSGQTVHLSAASAYDPPPGDGVEGTNSIPNATDGNPSTYWSTEHYASNTFGGLKNGVGLLLDAGRPVKLGTIRITTDLSGWIAEIRAGTSSTGPFERVSSSQTVSGTTTFSLNVPGDRRYYVIWITQLAPQADAAHVNEVTAG